MTGPKCSYLMEFLRYRIQSKIRGVVVINTKDLNLPYFKPMFHFYTPLKTFGFLTFSGGIETEHWFKMGLVF